MSEASSLKDKEKKKQLIQETVYSESKNGQTKNIPESLNIKKKKLQEKLKTVLSQAEAKKNKPVISLRQKMLEKLKAARFRFLNEQIYTTDSKEAHKIFKSDPEAFRAYHEGYRQQVKTWPLNPLDVIIKKY
ncbi:hypothetical protein NQ314_015310 [Rhamnusium bicolor]|uniref:Ribosomal RNA-processing protein 8 n=1 Tax=Rhamnusium bicolor TaxID=1586634 RepID=A0AAV8WYG6_9CUCU|nr:hypothetical protein NQ314_015310 [Rhamnusium bicolor]